MKPAATVVDLGPTTPDYHAQRAGWFVKDMLLKLLYLFAFLSIVGVCLDVHPEYKRAERMVSKQFETAEGARQSSTCMYYRGELSGPELVRWEKWAKAEGDSKCIEAEIVLSQSRMLLIARHLAYQYIPWSPGNASVVMRDVGLYILTATPLIGFFAKWMMSWGAGRVAEIAGVV